MENKFLIQGGIPLKGEVNISGNKNSAGVILAAALLTKQESIIDNLPRATDILDQIEILKEMGARIEWLTEKKIKINPANINPEKIPYDLFEKSLVHDPLYENRFQHLHELRKMGADIEIVDPHRALIFGKRELTGNKINSSDIRSGAALVLAGLIPKGETINNQ